MNKMKIISLVAIIVIAQQSIMLSSLRKQYAAAAVGGAGGGEPKKHVDPQPGKKTPAEIDADEAAVRAAQEKLKRDQEAEEARRKAAAGQASSASDAVQAAVAELKADDQTKADAIANYMEKANLEGNSNSPKGKALVDLIDRKKRIATGAAQQSNTLGRLGNKTSKHRYA